MDPIVDWERDTSQWSALIVAAHGCADFAAVSRNSLWPVYGPVMAAGKHIVIGQLGQSLDGRIATATGHSHYINGPAAITHLHRLRALVDAVIVGIGTVLADDPQLTVRRATLAPGKPQPARVIIDPNGRLPASARCLADDGARRIVVGGAGVAGAEHIPLPSGAGGIAASDVLKALAARGLTRVLVEGGAATLSRFLAAGCLDRLHIMTAPMIIGSGPVGLTLPEIARLDGALRPEVAVHALPRGDVLFDCAFRRKAFA